MRLGRRLLTYCVMPNKNDLSDLVKFCVSLALLVLIVAALFWRGAALAEEKFGGKARAAAAKISQQLWQKLDAAGK